jgi:hypothetical protein
MAPTIEVLFMSLTMRMAFLGAFTTVLLLGLLIPCLNLIAGAGRWQPPGAAALVAAGCLFAGASTSGFNRDDPLTNSKLVLSKSSYGALKYVPMAASLTRTIMLEA